MRWWEDKGGGGAIIKRNIWRGGRQAQVGGHREGNKIEKSKADSRRHGSGANDRQWEQQRKNRKKVRKK